MEQMRFSQQQIRAMAKFMGRLSGAEIQAKGLTDTECYHVIGVFEQFKAAKEQLNSKG